jgi:hypothetical protein
MPNSRILVILVLVLSVIATGMTELRGIIGGQTVVAYTIVALNLGVGIAGQWTRHRYAWMAYLALSMAGFLLISAATPITAAVLLVRLLLGL